ncbi:calcium-binding protein [Phaeobacter sp.]|uniref:calcium-binding protein n=1 Tax=Phaeobacter sp. TaxID=1902409 RepID=UPI0025CDA063|nr:calcium-binding protein [Phaeobacter sp.]
MANINIETGVDFVSGTTGDDTVVLTDALWASVQGNTATGNGGTDRIVLTADGDDFLNLSQRGLSYDVASGTWSIDGTTLTDGFQSVTLADGIALQAGVATSGVLSPSARPAPDGLGLELRVTDYAWDGAQASTNTFVVSSIVSVDGQTISRVGTSFTNGDGRFELTKDGDGIFSLGFTANTAAIAAQGNVGDTASFAFDVVVADSNGDTRLITVTYEQDITFGAGEDVFVGTDGADTVDGLSGNDKLSGRDGDDDLTGGAGNDTILGQNGDDTIFAGDDDDFVRGGNGDDQINVSGGKNNLGGGAGNDSITGASEEDTIFGGGGDDTIFGEGGADTINGGAGNDSLVGGNDEDLIKGGDGDDSLYGESGNDELRGGAGDDTVDGGAGNDVIYVSLGDDTLTGGGDSDVFVLRDDSGATVITDFSGGDQLDVRGLGYGSLADIMAIAHQTYDSGLSAVVLNIDADTTVTLEGVTLGQLSAADFDFA